MRSILMLKSLFSFCLNRFFFVYRHFKQNKNPHILDLAFIKITLFDKMEKLCFIFFTYSLYNLFAATLAFPHVFFFLDIQSFCLAPYLQTLSALSIPQFSSQMPQMICLRRENLAHKSYKTKLFV